jgi:VWFA-related protein
VVELKLLRLNRSMQCRRVRALTPAARRLLGAAAVFVLVAALGAAAPVPVYVTASFTDRNGFFIENLSRDEVRLLEDGSPRDLQLIARDDIPVVYGVVFDRAILPEAFELDRQRARPGIASGRDIAYELIDKVLGRQAVWVGVYDRDLRITLEPTTDGFRVKDAIHQLAGTRQPSESFLYGALVAAVQKMSSRSEKRRVLLLFLDAVDSESAGKAKALKNLLAGSNVELFVVSFASRLASGQGKVQFALTQGMLRELANATCGEAFFASDYRDHLDDISRRMLNQIRTLYTFGFLSPSTTQKPSRLEIQCTRSGSKVRHHPNATPP